ncbi:hypothetical protein [Mucilaginibacter sp.]|uniref:hypothetical protein n=1 Tax=Mucilaginibacter sp. TaxID=1882438 RepID=UPI00284A0A11|nr:hypothetical protein [Mucilaginibacter sp.]MDR3491220.1 hypothetical protein [Gammaproteobacteria bacterium]MDR3697177.1 hypothetical protein [Mucilaginibacter sp.]
MEIQSYKSKALKILSPIQPAIKAVEIPDIFFRVDCRSKAGYQLPVYYLVYFLFADLLEFPNLGKFEKIAWSFPIDYKGKTFLVEYRKMGLGIFVQNLATDETAAEEIVRKINGAVKSARPFYDYIAAEAIKKSNLNVNNNNRKLFARFNFLLEQYKTESGLAASSRNKYETKTEVTKFSKVANSLSLSYKHDEKANWYAISCVEAFFSWTEHLFIHLAIIAEGLADGEMITRLIEAEWKDKFRAAITDTSKTAVKFLDELLLVRQQLRNFVAHGAFGKEGNAFSFHSKTGAVPVIMNYKRQRNRFSLQGGLVFNDGETIALIGGFIMYLQTGSLKPAMFYTQESDLPTIVPYAANGFYQALCDDMETMERYCYELQQQLDDAANMDW